MSSDNKKHMKQMKYIVALATLCVIPLFAQADTYTNKYNVTLAWDASPSSPAVTITNYTVYYGPSSRNYTNVVLAGTNLTAVVQGLSAVTTYYFAATCNDATGLESDFSTEISYTTPRPKPLPPVNLRRTGP